MGTQLVEDDVARLHDAVGALRADLKGFSDRFDQFREDTVDWERKTHDIVVAQSEASRNLDRDIREMKPFFEDYRMKAAALNKAIESSEDYRDKKSELRGVKSIVVWLYGAVVLAAGWVGALIMKYLENWPQGPRPPHP